QRLVEDSAYHISARINGCERFTPGIPNVPPCANVLCGMLAVREHFGRSLAPKQLPRFRLIAQQLTQLFRRGKWLLSHRRFLQSSTFGQSASSACQPSARSLFLAYSGRCANRAVTERVNA